MSHALPSATPAAIAAFAQLPRGAVDRIIDVALAEDLASGDLTSECCIPVVTTAVAQAITRHPMVVCGGAVFARVFQRINPNLQVRLLRHDGERAESAEVIWRVSGSARDILAAERVALNLTQRMCGIASMAQRYVAAITEGSTTRVTDTRKTTPGLRLLERYAIRCGGAHNHRDNLGSAVMIKDNHIVACGTIASAVERAKQRAPHTSRIEVEVGDLDQFEQARAAGADIIMLDNMATPAVAEVMQRVSADRRRGHGPIIEVSGGITLARIAELSAIGVDIISVGALTHSAKAADISLEFAFDDSQPTTV